MATSSTSFKPGQSGNPNGRPSKRRKDLDELLDAVFTNARQKAVIEQLIADAEKGNHEARSLLMAYTYGKPVDRKEISGPDGEPLKAYVNFSPAEWDNEPPEAD